MNSINRQSGMAMVLVMTVLAALLAIGAIGLSMQLNSTKSATLAKDSRSALYCAEAGLAAARNILVLRRDSWDELLLLDGAESTDPIPYPIVGDFDGDGTNDYSVIIKDDGDDTVTTTDDNDTIIVISTCTKFASAPTKVMEVISFEGQGNTYRNQSGQGPGNTGNAN